MHLILAHRIWIGLLLVLLFILFTGWRIYASQFSYEFQSVAEAALVDAEFISSLVEERLQNKDYEQARVLLVKWAERTPQLAEVILTARNGYVLGHYKNPVPSSHTITEKVEIPYSYNGWATLTLRTSIDSVYAHREKLRRQFIIGYLLITLSLFYLVFVNRRIQQQKKELTIENRRRLDAENELREHRDHLEELVHERTRELEHMRDEALSAMRAKNQFLASVSHELRTPLNSIIGFTGIVRDGGAGQVNDEQKKQLAMAHKSALHLLKLINEILDLSKIEAGKQEIVNELFSFPAFVEEITAMIQPLVDEKRLELKVDISDAPVSLYTDRGKLQQVMLNLLGNAVKFTDDGTITLHSKMDRDSLDISITDTGIGIAASDHEMIFGAFSQVDSGDSRRHGGTGLGLVICMEYVAMMGGSLRLDSAPGEGSTFTIHLPLYTTKAGEKQQ